MFLVNVILLVINAAASDLSLRYFISDIMKQNIAPKHWHQYIVEFLSVHFDYIPIDCDTIGLDRVFSKQEKLSSYLYILGQEMEIYSPPSKLLTKDWCLIKELCSDAEGIIAMLNPFGDTYFVENSMKKAAGQFAFSGSVSGACMNVLWAFNLNPKLRLNFTSVHLYFKSKYSACHLQQVKIHKALPNIVVRPMGTRTGYQAASVQVRNILRKNAFVFCGQHSTFSLYPSFSAVDVRIIAFRPDDLTLTVIYSVVDNKNTIHSLTSLTQDPKPYITHTIGGDCAVLSYCIKVQKVKHVVIYTADLKVVIYDGPGFLSPIVKPNRSNVVSASSFECTVQVLYEINKTHPVRFDSNLISTVQVHHQSSENQTGVVFDLPWPKYDTIPSVVSIQAETGLQINATVLVMRCIGLASITCKYAGLTAAEAFPHGYKEHVVMCHNHNISSRPYKSFFSSNSSLIVILFSFKHYSSSVASLVVSGTSCKGTQIDICTFNNLCGLSTTKRCASFLKNKVDSLPNFQLSNKRQIVKFSIPVDTCYILQLTTNNTIEGTPKHGDLKCWMCLLSEQISDQNISVRFMII